MRGILRDTEADTPELPVPPALPVEEGEEVKLVGELGVPVVLELGVPVGLELAVPVVEEEGVPVGLELGVPVRLELTLLVGVVEGVPVGEEVWLGHKCIVSARRNTFFLRYGGAPNGRYGPMLQW